MKTSVDTAFREMIRDEVETQLKPLQTLVHRLAASADGLDRLSALAEGLGPVAALFGGTAGVKLQGRKGPGVAGRTGRRGRPATLNNRSCAIIGCGRAARTKGYCAAHYQKLRALTRSNRLPAEWTDFAPENSVADVVLPRGRAAAKLKAEAKKNRRTRSR